MFWHLRAPACYYDTNKDSNFPRIIFWLFFEKLQLKESNKSILLVETHIIYKSSIYLSGDAFGEYHYTEFSEPDLVKY